jgi:hypothetical protein
LWKSEILIWVDSDENDIEVEAQTEVIWDVLIEWQETGQNEDIEQEIVVAEKEIDIIQEEDGQLPTQAEEEEGLTDLDYEQMKNVFGNLIE